MTEPPRPPGEYGGPTDPTSSPPTPPSYPPPGEAPAAPNFATPPGSPPPGDPGAYGAPGPNQYPPQGGGYPPAGYGAPPAGYGQPAGTYGAPAGYATADEKTWALISHFGGAAGAFITGGVGGWIAPLIALLAKGNESATTRAHAVAALNFQITWAIATVLGWILATCTLGLLFFVPLIVMLVPVVIGIIAGVKANDGQFYKYPMSINMVK